MAKTGFIEKKYVFNSVGNIGGIFGLKWTLLSQSKDKNQSIIKWEFYYSMPNGIYQTTSEYVNNCPYTITVGPSIQTNKVTLSIVKPNQTVVIASGETPIFHTATGTADFAFSFNVTELGYMDHNVGGVRYGKQCYANSRGVIDELLGAKATILTAPDFTDEESPTITYSNPSGNNAEALWVCVAFYDSNSKQWHPTGGGYKQVTLTSSSYTFNFTEAERKVLRKGVTWGNTVDIRFYVRTTIKGEYLFSSITKTLTLTNHAPTLSPVIKDTGSISITLTNDPTKIIKYYNVMSINMRAEAKKEAVLASQTVTCGGQTVSSTDTASLSDFLSYVESGTFECSIRDSRGLRESATVTLDLIEYFKPTCDFVLKAPTTDGDMIFGASGSFFNDYFGDAGVAQHNALTIKYRIKVNSEAFGDWVTVPAAEITIDGNDYSFEKMISDLDYLNAYTVEVLVTDLVGRYSITRSKKVKTTPVYDWSSEDFNFNVDVNFTDEAHFNNVANFNKSIKTAHNSIIYGKNTNGEDVIAMKTCNTNNNLILGYGNWDKELGGTNIYGNNVNIMTKNDFKINNTKSLLGLYNAMTSTYGFSFADGTVTVTAGPNYTSITGTNIVLIGNQMRLMLTANRNAAADGNIANEKVATITIHHGEKIKGFYNTSFGNGSTGGVASFYTTNAVTVAADTIQFDLMLAAVSGSSNQFQIIATLPIAINPEYYV